MKQHRLLTVGLLAAAVMVGPFAGAGTAATRELNNVNPTHGSSLSNATIVLVKNNWIPNAPSANHYLQLMKADGTLFANSPTWGLSNGATCNCTAFTGVIGGRQIKLRANHHVYGNVSGLA